MYLGWYEVWADEGPEFPYLLMVRYDRNNDQMYELIDPRENNKVILKSKDYDEIRFELLEDEYTPIKGRMDLS